MKTDSLGRFVKGAVPHNKRDFVSCRIRGCNRTDHKGHGYCGKHFCMRKNRIKNGQQHDDLSLEKRLPRTEEHKKNNIAYTKNPEFVSALKGKTYKEIYGERYEEHKDRHQKSLIGINKGKPSPLKGTKTGKPAWNRGKVHCAKEKNAAWRGGVSREKYGFEFTKQLRESIRNRDNYKCVCCACPEIELGRKLSIHHIDHNKKNNESSNLVSLCVDCHAKIHWCKDEWANFLKSKLNQVKELLCR